MKGTHRLVKHPETGEWVWVEKGPRRAPEPVAPMALVKADRHFVAYTQPRAERINGEWVHANPAARDFDDQGRPRFESMRAVQEYKKASWDVSDVDGVEYE